MRITHADIWKVVVPCRPDVLERAGRWHDPGLSHFDEIHKWIVRVHTDTGLTGLGESSRGESEASIRTGVQALLGHDPRRFPLSRLPLPAEASYPTFEMAIFDLLGKAWDVPAYTLLGGARQPAVLVDYWASRRSPEDTGRMAARGKELGFHGIKIKAALAAPGTPSTGAEASSPGDHSQRLAVPEGDPVVEKVRAIAGACGPDFTITLDPNCRFYHPAEVVRLARALEEYNILVLEDPVPWQNHLDWYVLLRQKIGIPIAMHLFRPADVLAAIKAEAVDYLNINGSMMDFVKMAGMAETAGVRCWHGSGVDLGIRDTAYLHASLAVANCTLPSDIVGNFLREDDLILEPIPIVNGYWRPTDAPGLGVELDEAAVRKYSVAW